MVQIVNSELTGVGTATLALVSKDNLRRMVQRKRNDISGAPANPTSLRNLVIPYKYKTYCIIQHQEKVHVSVLANWALLTIYNICTEFI